LGHAKPYSSFNSWSNLLIFGHNTVHGHMHRLTLVYLFVPECPNGSRLNLEICEIYHIFPSGTESMGDRGSKKAYMRARTGMYLPTKFDCDRSIVVGCRPSDDRHPDRQTNRQTSWNDNKAHSLCCATNVTQQVRWHDASRSQRQEYALKGCHLDIRAQIKKADVSRCVCRWRVLCPNISKLGHEL